VVATLANAWGSEFTAESPGLASVATGSANVYTTYMALCAKLCEKDRTEINNVASGLLISAENFPRDVSIALARADVLGSGSCGGEPTNADRGTLTPSGEP
jgi:hypothetical protein